MNKTEALIFQLLGPTRKNIRALVYAVDITAHLLFVEKISMDEIHVTKHVYPLVAERLKKRPAAATKNIERLANRCWDRGDPELLEKIIGRRLNDLQAPRDMIFYLAYFSYLDEPFYSSIMRSPSLLF